MKKAIFFITLMFGDPFERKRACFHLYPKFMPESISQRQTQNKQQVDSFKSKISQPVIFRKFAGRLLE